LFAFDEKRLVKVLDRLSPVLRTAFATVCAARLASLLSHNDVVHTSTKETLTNAVDMLKTDVRESGQTAVDWQTLLKRVMALLPGEDETSEEGLVLLDDSVAAIAYAIRTRLTGSSQEAAWSARRCYGYFDHVANTDFAILGIDEPTEERLLAHPRTQEELRRQHDLLEFLQGKETEQDLSAVLDEP
jgi:hypothetical protein